MDSQETAVRLCDSGVDQQDVTLQCSNGSRPRLCLSGTVGSASPSVAFAPLPCVGQTNPQHSLQSAWEPSSSSVAVQDDRVKYHRNGYARGFRLSPQPLYSSVASVHAQHPVRRGYHIAASIRRSGSWPIATTVQKGYVLLVNPTIT